MKYSISIAVPGQEPTIVERERDNLHELLDDLLWDTPSALKGCNLEKIVSVEFGVQSKEEEPVDSVPADGEGEGNQEANSGVADSATKDG